MGAGAAEQDAEGAPPDIRIVAEVAAAYSHAAYQNAVPLLRVLALVHAGGESLAGCRLELSAVPPFVRPRAWTIGRLRPGDALSASDLRLELEPAFLAGLDEAVRGELSLVLRQGVGDRAGGHIVAEAHHPVRLLARDEWGGIAAMARLLPAFVTPNDPAVPALLRSASEKLARHGFPPGLDGYQSGDPGRARLVAAALYAALAERDIRYAEPPASFESRGQKVRRPSTIMATGLATCLDSALLFAAVFEAAGLDPVLLLFDGHAAAGVWLTRRTLPEAVVASPMELRTAIAAGELLVLETTGVTYRPGLSVADAEAALVARLAEEPGANFRAAVDVRRLRDAGIAPLASPASAPAPAQAGPKAAPADPPAPDAERAPAPLPPEAKPTTPEGRIRCWQRQLLDLTPRNRLLDFRHTATTVPFRRADLALLEHRLAGGAGLRIIPAPDHTEPGARDAGIHREIERGPAAGASDRDDLPAPLPAAELEARLVGLHRAAREDLAEGGANTLALAIGFLRWRKAGDGRDNRAPLLLLPVRLERVAASAEFRLRFHEDEPCFNATLLRFLEQEFHLSLPQLDGDLPRDGSGIDVPRLLAEVRRAVRDVPDMEVVDAAALATFPFARYLMWRDLAEHADLVRQNRVLRHLIECPETPFPGADRPAPWEEDLDRDDAPGDTVSLLPEDSSQQAASLMAAAGHDMVVVGPPGSGKSQTIANTIARCLAAGRTVLFVAEKSAALDVVHRRLRAHGLGAHCIGLHSGKADRKGFVDQLRASWEHGGAAADDGARAAVSERLRLARDELNAHAEALHRPHANGLTAYAAIGLVLKGDGAFAPALAWPHLDVHDVPARAALEDLAREIGRSFAAVDGRPVLRLVEAQGWSHPWQQSLIAAAVALKAAADDLARAFDGFLAALGLPASPAAPLVGIARFARLALAVEACAGDDHGIVFDADFDQLLPALEALEAEIAAARVVETALAGRFAPDEIMGIPVEALLADWRAASAALWPMRRVRQSRIRKQLAAHARPASRTEPREALPLLARMQGHVAAIESNLLARKAPRLAGLDTDVAGLRAWIERARDLRAAVLALNLAEDAAGEAANAIAPVVTTGGDPYGVRDAGARLGAALVDFTAAARAVAEAAGCRLGTLVREGTLAGLSGAMADLVAERSALADWIIWRGVRRRAEASGLGPMVAALEAAALVPEQAEDVFRLAYARWWLPLAMDADPVLRGFRRVRHEHAIAAFRELDDLACAHAAGRVRQGIAHGLPPAESAPRQSELGLLRDQMAMKRPTCSIRALITALPASFPRLAPCMLMSPLSVARYLPAKPALFDVVIIDEASRITPWDAAGAIARGRQTVVVGDPKQLPPTHLLGRSDEDEEVADCERDLESILGEAMASGLPVRNLPWHYRSRHESLIAFSNRHSYDSRLITFPSPEVEDKAVCLRLVPEGVYDRGRSRTNLIEARGVAAEAVARMRAALALPGRSRPTLGIIAFNARQQALIQDLLDTARRQAPEIEWFFSDDRLEPTMVKHLENVQGDERDVILLSLTYTRDGAGAPATGFGALDRVGGERRLNVAATRARQELVVFSGTTADDIDLGRARSAGARHLKAFLDFAAGGALAPAPAGQGSTGGPESPFEEAVAGALAARGWQVAPQVMPRVGVSGFRLDLAVRHPARAGRFLAGIECDGATYRRAATARDRDKVRPEVLRGLGWHILRVWSIDWWRDHAGAAERLDEALRALLADDRDRQGEGGAPARWELGEMVRSGGE